MEKDKAKLVIEGSQESGLPEDIVKRDMAVSLGSRSCFDKLDKVDRDDLAPIATFLPIFIAGIRLGYVFNNVSVTDTKSI